MMDAQRVNQTNQTIVYDELSRLSYPSELKQHYRLLDENLQLLESREKCRSEEQTYEDELRSLEIKIEYPIALERYQGFNTVPFQSTQQIIIRHAFALHNFVKRSFSFDDRRIYSSQLMDPPLHYFGKRQCEYLKQFVHKVDFSVVFISPLLRTVQTAQILFQDHPKKKQIKFILLPIAAEKMSSQYSFFRWGRLAQLQMQQEQDPQLIQIDLSAFDEFKYKEMWQLEMINKHETQYKLEDVRSDKLSEALESFVSHHFVKQGKSVSIESEEMCYRRGLRLKELMRDAASKNSDSNKKVGLISHSVLIKTFFAKGLDADKKIIKDPTFYLENGNLTGLNL